MSRMRMRMMRGDRKGGWKVEEAERGAMMVKEEKEGRIDKRRGVSPSLSMLSSRSPSSDITAFGHVSYFVGSISVTMIGKRRSIPPCGILRYEAR